MTAVQSFYRDRTVFITGGTGFIGKIIIEKLLRWVKKSPSRYSPLNWKPKTLYPF